MPFPGLAERLADVRARIDAAVARGGRGQQVEIVAVTKTYGPDAVVAAADAGIRVVGENRVQEALTKMDACPIPMRWHLIGHLQRNKAKHADRFELVHSVDSLRIAEALSEEGLRRGTPIRGLMQVNISGEDTKGGLTAADVREAVPRLRELLGLEIRGVMTMAPFDAPPAVLSTTFR